MNGQQSGNPILFFYFHPQRKIGFPDCFENQFFKTYGFWENSLPACSRVAIPKIIFAIWVAKQSISVLGYMSAYKRNFRGFGCETQKSVLGYIEGYEKLFEEI